MPNTCFQNEIATANNVNFTAVFVAKWPFFLHFAETGLKQAYSKVIIRTAGNARQSWTTRKKYSIKKRVLIAADVYENIIR